jgi:DegV family protein with EDD domain
MKLDRNNLLRRSKTKQHLMGEIKLTDKIAMLVDSGMDMPPELIEKGGVFVAPLNIMYTDKTYMDKIEISAAEIYARLDEEVPKTSLPSISYVQTLIEDIKNQGYNKILCITISSGLSGTHNALRLTLEEHEEIESFMVDTKSIGIGGGIQAAFIKREIDNGISFDELKKVASELPIKGGVFFSIPTLEYLKKGGRIGLVSSIIGTALNLNPIISCNEDGIYYTVNKARGRKKSLAKLIDSVEKTIAGYDEYDLSVTYGDDKEEAEKLMAAMKEKFSNYRHFYFGEVSPVLGAHTGPGVIGIGVLPIK